MTGSIRGLPELMAEMRNAPHPYRPSPFWEELSAITARQLDRGGFDNFKRSVNMLYFNWDVIGILRHQLLPILGHWVKQRDTRVLQARFPNYGLPSGYRQAYHSAANFRLQVPDMAYFTGAGAVFYRTYVAMLWEYVASMDRLGLLSGIDEPPVGNPFAVEYRGCSTSQDLCNSVHEFYSAACDEYVGQSDRSIVELGGGYGRLAYVCLKALPSASYCLIDIAPTLNIAQEYLSRVFPGEKIFYFRPFQRFGEVQAEFESARIRFLAAHQIELLPPKVFDTFINISSLHEMSYEQIETYIRQIDRVTRRRFYTKQWRRSHAKVNGVVMREHDYPIPAAWRQVYHATHPVQRLFFHALYDLGG